MTGVGKRIFPGVVWGWALRRDDWVLKWPIKLFTWFCRDFGVMGVDGVPSQLLYAGAHVSWCTLLFCVFDLCALCVLNGVMCVSLTFRGVRGVGRGFLSTVKVVYGSAHLEICLILGVSVGFRLFVLPWALGPPLGPPPRL